MLNKIDTIIATFYKYLVMIGRTFTIKKFNASNSSCKTDYFTLQYPNTTLLVYALFICRSRPALRILLATPQADVFLGPVCDYVIAPVARYASVWKIPVVTPAAQANAFMDKQGQFPTLTRILGSYHQLGTAFKPLLKRFNWKVAGLLYEDYATDQNRGFHRCNFMLKAIYMDMDIKPAHFSFVTSDSRSRIVQLLDEVSKSARSKYRHLVLKFQVPDSLSQSKTCNTKLEICETQSHDSNLSSLKFKIADYELFRCFG